MITINLIETILFRVYTEECSYNEGSLDTDTYLKLVTLLQELKECVK